ncbi:AcrR family transcriptional regulator [Microbacterium terrae]|uniref:TetR/AcrR family transcriptional regulator n=1 Tax=Microbacterium terrae TaxID=69369 RepID=UPI0005EC0555|nr:TetR/AcrR family transcriptional regulator [Microbacterium terrae]MBP1078689.1 AcrR family transcriptional regulator [Microbacterium terrae]
MTGTRSASNKRSTGRRAGNSGTRDAILDAARDLFAQHGYEKTSVRAIASQAGVDPALIRHFFADKETLFAQTMGARTTIPERIATALNGDPSTIGERLADAYLQLWDDETTRPILVGLARSAMTSLRAQRMLAEALFTRIRADAPFPNPTDPRARGLALSGANLLGIAILRNVFEIPALTGIPHTELVALVAPHIQTYIDGSRSIDNSD